MLNIESMEPLAASIAAHVVNRLTAAPVGDTMTFGELFNLYYEHHAKIRCKNPANAYYFFKAHGPKWQDIQVHHINRKAVQAWVDELGKESPSAANRALHMLSAIINWGIRKDHIPSMVNPCKSVDKFVAQPRERFAAPKELIKLNAALALESPLMRDFFLVTLMTGARRGNVLAMKWADIDFDLAAWTIPGNEFKNGSSHTVPLTQEVLSILARRRGSGSGYPWVFPGDGATGHIVEPKRAWARVLKRAGLNDLHIHDLRRTLASYMAMKGQSPYIIARMLGHKDMRSTTVYARLDLGAVRDGAEAVSQQWQDILALPAPGVLRLEGKPEQKSGAPRALPKNAGVRLSAAEQIVVEARILTALRTGGSTKKHFYQRMGSHIKLNSQELDRVLSEMEARGLISRHITDKGACHYHLSEN